ncbi:MAG: hypothetical protein AUJ20_12750 [Comamonadaceae bacterium CG1_02_60_18]|nr:MAG: hypothetical protein AUJ20_12750 [Comamonadaceae bacterium CG1_02_60_18]
MSAPPRDCPPWSAWVLERLQMGLLVLDAQGDVVFANQWLLTHTKLAADAVLSKNLMEVFPQLKDSAFAHALAQSIKSGFPTLLSQTLHPSPFPLYLPSSQRGQDKLLRQSIRIMPAGGLVADTMDQRYTFIQINDVTQSVMRERLLKAQAVRLKNMAQVDVLTGLGNRRRRDDVLPTALRASGKTAQPLSVIMFDIDYFKQFNDIYGHLAGDECLRQVAQVLRDVFRRPQDMVARFGGEEFVAVLPETDGQAAQALAEQVLQQMRALGIAHSGSCTAAVVTISAGVAVYDPAGGQTPDRLVLAADQALYAAKSAGRNQVCGPQ